MPKLTINDQVIEVPEGTTVLQAAQQLDIEVPVFCYHPRLAVAGNCRMCLVEMEKSPKPIASCAMPASEGMVIRTNTPMVEKARQGVLEFLLINHPLDCPICDQGGECDLQDITMNYAGDRSRFKENKRAVVDKDFGPLIKTVMTRCIHCTRCVRFATDVAGVPDLGGLGRGEHMEIGTYIDKAVGSELSGNMIDICPVGALTSKPYAFTGRSWELTKTESIDVLDATGAAIRVDSYGQIVRRILPRLNEDINEEWLGDKSRFACDGLAQQRLDRPYVRRDGKLVPCTWTEALEAVASKLKATAPERVAAIIGDLVDAETMVVLKDLFTHLNINTIDCRQDNAFYDTSTRAGYLFNTTIAGIENADACLLVGTNLRWEAPLLNARVRKRWLTTLLPVGLVGAAVDLTYPALHLGTTPQVLQELAEGRGEFATTLEKIHSQGGKIMLILGAAALAHRDAAAILDLCSKITTRYGLMTDTWNGFNILQHAASRVAALDLGLVPRDPSVNVTKLLDQCSRGDTEVMYLLGADEIDTTKLQNTFVIYQGHHGDRGAHVADVILPGAAYTEKSGTYINTEGRVQHTQVAVFPPGEAKEDWKILRALADALGVEMHMNTLAQVRQRLVEVNPVFQTLNQITPAPWHPLGTTGTASDTPFNTTIHDYYMTDPISRHSPTMAKCRQTFGGSQR